MTTILDPDAPTIEIAFEKIVDRSAVVASAAHTISDHFKVLRAGGDSSRLLFSFQVDGDLPKMKEVAEELIDNPEIRGVALIITRGIEVGYLIYGDSGRGSMFPVVDGALRGVERIVH